MFQNLIELLKTPGMAALIAATTAIVSAALTQSLTRKAAERQWLRERRGRAYDELLTSLDYLADVLIRLSAHPTPENSQDLKTASEQFQRARSLATLYAPKSVSALLGQADLVFIQKVGAPDQYLAGTVALVAIRERIVQSAREQLGSAS